MRAKQLEEVSRCVGVGLVRVGVRIRVGFGVIKDIFNVYIISSLCVFFFGSFFLVSLVFLAFVGGLQSMGGMQWMMSEC